MLYPSLLAVHVFCAIFWGGGGLIGAFFLMPSVARTLCGPDEAARTAAASSQRCYGLTLGVFSGLAVLSGAILLVLRGHETPAWFAGADGITLCLGAMIGLGAYFIGAVILRPRYARVLSLAQVGPTGTAALVAEQTKLIRSAKVAAWHLVAAALFMVSHGLVGLVLAR